MRPEIVLRYVGLILLINALFLLISSIISLVQADGAFNYLMYSTTVALLLGLFPLLFVPPTMEITNKEGLFIIVAGWLISCLVGIMPFVLWGGPFTFTNAWFESVSGFTTTGSSILAEIESIPKGLLFWRASTHWIGGVGIIVFVLAALPSMGTASMVLYRTETSALAIKDFRYRTRETLKIILYVYIGLTAIETIALMIAGLSPFDAVTHSFATIATGGFSTKNTSVAFFNSVAVESIIILFMLLSGIHFGLLFMFVSGKIRPLYESTIVRYYLISILLGTFAVAINICGSTYDSWGEAIRYAAFQVVSIGTSTGFANADSSLWPAFSMLVLLFFTLQCACAGSTSGGIKVDRIVLFCKALLREVLYLRHPRGVFMIKIDNSNLGDQNVNSAIIFILLYFAILFVSTSIITFVGVDLMTAFSGVAAAMGNVGPGFGLVGSMNNFSALPSLAKWVLSFDMLLGRLEIYSLILFFTIRQWK